MGMSSAAKGRIVELLSGLREGYEGMRGQVSALRSELGRFDSEYEDLLASLRKQAAAAYAQTSAPSLATAIVSPVSAAVQAVLFMTRFLKEFEDETGATSSFKKHWRQILDVSVQAQAEFRALSSLTLGDLVAAGVLTGEQALDIRSRAGSKRDEYVYNVELIAMRNGMEQQMRAADAASRGLMAELAALDDDLRKIASRRRWTPNGSVPSWAMSEQATDQRIRSLVPNKRGELKNQAAAAKEKAERELDKDEGGLFSVIFGLVFAVFPFYRSFFAIMAGENIPASIDLLASANVAVSVYAREYVAEYRRARVEKKLGDEKAQETASKEASEKAIAAAAPDFREALGRQKHGSSLIDELIGKGLPWWVYLGLATVGVVAVGAVALPYLRGAGVLKNPPRKRRGRRRRKAGGIPLLPVLAVGGAGVTAYMLLRDTRSAGDEQPVASTVPSELIPTLPARRPTPGFTLEPFPETERGATVSPQVSRVLAGYVNLGQSAAQVKMRLRDQGISFEEVDTGTVFQYFVPQSRKAQAEQIINLVIKDYELPMFTMTTVG